MSPAIVTPVRTRRSQVVHLTRDAHGTLCGRVLKAPLIEPDKQASYVRVLAFDPHLSVEQIAERGGVKVSLDELLAQSDFVSLNGPLSSETAGSFGAGLAVTSGNSNTSNWNVSFKAKREPATGLILSADGLLIRGTKDGELSTDKSLLNSRSELRFANKSYVFVQTAYLRDTFGALYVGAVHGRLLTAWSLAGVAGPVLVNYLRAWQIERGVPKAEAYSVTMYVMASLLVLGFGVWGLFNATSLGGRLWQGIVCTV